MLDFDDLRDRPLELLERCVRFLKLDEDFRFELRGPANVRRTTQGAPFQLEPAQRAALRETLRADITRFGAASASTWVSGGLPECDRR